MSGSRISRLLSSLLAAVLPAAAAAAAPLPTATAPALVFDLRPYQLGLPVNRLGLPLGTAATISNEQLNGSPGYRSSYFYVQSDGALVFHAPSNGATTTPGVGSDHTRSELRERYHGDGSTEWPNRRGGLLRADCVIQKTAQRATGTTIGQIHGLDSMMMLLSYRSDAKTVSAVVLDAPNARRSREIVLARAVETGDHLRYAIQWIGRSLSITVNGRTVNLSTAPA